MNTNETIALAIEQLLGEVRRLQMAEQVQKGMWTVLVRHLAASDLLDLDALAESVELLAQTQDHEDWQALHDDYLTMLGILRSGALATG